MRYNIISSRCCAEIAAAHHAVAVEVDAPVPRAAVVALALGFVGMYSGTRSTSAQPVDPDVVLSNE